MFLQSRALRSRVEKSSILESILESKTGQKSMKTEVRKRIENRSPSGSDFYRFWEDFGSQEPPRNRPKIVQNRTFGPLGPNARTSKASGSQFGRFRHDLGAILDDFGTIFERLWAILHTMFASYCTDPCFEERTIQPLPRNQTSKNTL